MVSPAMRIVNNFLGQTVYLPNRTIGTVSRHRSGCIRMYVDVQVPPGMEDDALVEVIEPMLRGVRKQFGAIVLAEPEVFGVRDAEPGGWRYVPATLRPWPGQQSTVEPVVRQRILAALRQRSPDYQDWMPGVTNRIA